MLLGIEHDVCSIFTNGNDARREREIHAANEGLIVTWARTLRIDSALTDAIGNGVTALARGGVRARIRDVPIVPRVYALIEGPESVDPAQFAQSVPNAKWYDAAIIALAIEPLPADALPQLADALSGPGAPAGICACETVGERLVLEFRPDVTPPALVNGIIDVELRRYGGTRRVALLCPLPTALLAEVAAEGLQAPEVATDRILESLLGLEHAE